LAPLKLTTVVKVCAGEVIASTAQQIHKRKIVFHDLSLIRMGLLLRPNGPDTFGPFG
jgi:hypothetical protein